MTKKSDERDEQVEQATLREYAAADDRAAAKLPDAKPEPVEADVAKDDPKDETKDKDDEFPHWAYPPDGGPGKVIQTPDEWPDGWLKGPVKGGGKGGERVIGQPEGPGVNEGEDTTDPPADSEFHPSKATRKK